MMNVMNGLSILYKVGGLDMVCYGMVRYTMLCCAVLCCDVM